MTRALDLGDVQADVARTIAGVVMRRLCLREHRRSRACATLLNLGQTGAAALTGLSSSLSPGRRTCVQFALIDFLCVCELVADALRRRSRWS